jgi:uncharacterized UPF0160 family protein
MATTSIAVSNGISNKRQKTELSPGSPVTIGTHNGHFHADEALAVYMLRNHVPRYANAQLTRTRDASVLATLDTVVDVGGEYEHAKRRYDHHQRTFATTFPGRPTKLSSAGLVYMHYGKEIVARKLGLEVGDTSIEAGADGTLDKDPRVPLVYKKIYESFIEALDAHDNGISAYDPSQLTAAGIDKRFSEGGFGLGALVGRRNGNWNDPTPADPAEAQKAEDARFETASRRIGEEFDLDLDFYTNAWLPARSVVETAFAKRKEFDSQGRILVFEGQSVPWKDHLYTLEEENSSETPEGKAIYVLYAESTAPGAKWRVQAVPVSKDSFESRKPLPAAWRGVRDDALDGVTGIPGCIFVHASGFIGGNKTFDGALTMAKKALEI